MNHLLFYVKENQITPTYSFLNFFIFFFSPVFKYKKKIISLFSGTERHTKLKLGPHMVIRLMYHVYLNQAAGVYLFLCFFNFLSLKFQNINFLSHFSVRPTKLKLCTHMGKGLIYCVHQLQAARTYLFLYFSSFFLSLQLAKIKTLLLQNCFNIPLMSTAEGYVSFAHSLLSTIFILTLGRPVLALPSKSECQARSN